MPLLSSAKYMSNLNRSLASAKINKQKDIKFRSRHGSVYASPLNSRLKTRNLVG